MPHNVKGSKSALIKIQSEKIECKEYANVGYRNDKKKK